MSTMNVSLPGDLKSFVDRRVAEGTYGTSSEYIRELIRRDQARLELRALVLEGLESPPVAVANAAYWASKRAPAKRGKRRRA